MDGLFEGSLRVLTELSLDLLGPMANGRLENGGLILGRGLLGLSHVGGRQGQTCSTLDQAQGHLGVGQELVEVVHQILAHQVGPADLVKGVSKNGQENVLN